MIVGPSVEQLNHEYRLNNYLYNLHTNWKKVFVFHKNQQKTFYSLSVFVPVIVGPSVEQLNHE